MELVYQVVKNSALLLRALLLTKAPVLILDEATSGLDVLTEKQVYPQFTISVRQNYYLRSPSFEHRRTIRPCIGA